MVLGSEPIDDMFENHILKLPRELRNLIYQYLVQRDDPTPLTNVHTPPEMSTLRINEEILEAEFTYNTFILIFPTRNLGYIHGPATSIYGPYWKYRKFLRHLIVEVTEISLEDTDDLQSLERECTVTRPEVRQEWEKLLELPRLQSLTINMQKLLPDRFVWANFSPILYELRSNLPKIKITFHVSFDDLLKYYWYYNWDQIQNNSEEEAVYDPMSFVDISDLIAAPNDEDREYVKTYIPQRKIRNKKLHIAEGLIEEKRVNKRLLASTYVTSEPNLTRVLMEEHWGVYKKCKQEMEEKTGEEVRTAQPPLC